MSADAGCTYRISSLAAAFVCQWTKWPRIGCVSAERTRCRDQQSPVAHYNTQCAANLKGGGSLKGFFGCPTRIRTWTKGSKDLCATVTPSDKPALNYSLIPTAQREKSPPATLPWNRLVGPGH